MRVEYGAALTLRRCNYGLVMLSIVEFHGDRFQSEIERCA